MRPGRPGNPRGQAGRTPRPAGGSSQSTGSAAGSSGVGNGGTAAPRTETDQRRRRLRTRYRCLSSRRRCGTDEAGLVGDDDELGAVAGVQFHHGPLDMGTYRMGAEEELSGDLIVGMSFGGQGHDLAFPDGEAGEDVVVCEVAAWFGGGEEEGDECPGGLGG